MKVKAITDHEDYSWGVSAQNASHLVIGQEYTLARVSIQSCYTLYWLVEIPGLSFSSVWFTGGPYAACETQEPMNITRPRLLGLSMSQCIFDLIYDRVAYDDVELIVTNTFVEDFNDQMQIEELLHVYCDSAFRYNDRATFHIMLMRLVKDDKIVQPRLVTGNQWSHCPPGNRDNWLDFDLPWRFKAPEHPYCHTLVTGTVVNT